MVRRSSTNEYEVGKVVQNELQDVRTPTQQASEKDMRQSESKADQDENKRTVATIIGRKSIDSNHSIDSAVVQKVSQTADEHLAELQK